MEVTFPALTVFAFCCSCFCRAKMLTLPAELQALCLGPNPQLRTRRVCRAFNTAHDNQRTTLVVYANHQLTCDGKLPDLETLLNCLRNLKKLVLRNMVASNLYILAKLPSLSGRLTSLEMPDITTGRPTFMNAIGKLTKLTSLVLGQVRGPGDLSFVSGLTALRYLRVGGPKAVTFVKPGLNALNALNALTFVVLDGAGMPIQLSALQGLKALTRLHLNDTEITDRDLAELTALSSLRTLEIKHTSQLTNVAPLRWLTSLSHLAIGSAGQVTSSTLSLLTNLTYLHMQSYREQVFSLAETTALCKLEELHMFHHGCVIVPSNVRGTL